MQWFSALIPAYPEIQKRAQEDLDRVVGRDRLPTVEDEAALPYIHAIVKEVERCHNPFWLGTPHVASENFTYNGKFIPKDTVVVLNTWTMHHDEKRHPNPMEFNVSFIPLEVVQLWTQWDESLMRYIKSSLIGTSTTTSRRLSPPTSAIPTSATTGCSGLGGGYARP